MPNPTSTTHDIDITAIVRQARASVRTTSVRRSGAAWQRVRDLWTERHLERKTASGASEALVAD
jgi:hypothetical protein